MNIILKKYKALQRTVKAALWFTLCNFLLKGISFITAPLFAKYLSPYEYGKMSIYGAYEQLFLIFATLELSLGVYQRGLLQYKEDLRSFTQSLLLLSNVTTAAVFVAVLPFAGRFIRATETSTGILVLMFVYFLVQPAYTCWINRKRFVFDYRSAVTAALAFSLLSTAGPLAAVVLAGRTAEIKIETMLILEICFCLPFYIKGINFNGLRRGMSRIRNDWSYMLSYQLPLVLHALSYLVLAQADRVMIGEMVGKTQAAYYSVAYSLAYSIVLIQTSLNQVLKPWRFQKLETKDYKAVGKTTNGMLFLIAAAILLFILIAPEIMKVLFREEYYEAVWTIPPVSLSVFFMFLYNAFTDVESYFSKTKYIMYASVICAALNIAFNYQGIKMFGYIACGYTTLFSYVMFALLHYLFMRRVCIREKLKTQVFDIKTAGLISLGALCLSGLIVVAYPFPAVRYAAAAGIALLGFRNKKKIQIMFYMVREKEVHS